MEKLYLIRVDLERFLGPFTLKQVKEAYIRMEFGMQDEVAGSLRPWVSFDDLAAIRKQYPEMVQLVQREMLSGWGVSSHGLIIQKPKVKIRVKPKIKRSSGNSVLRFAIFMAILVALGILVREVQRMEWVLFFKDRTLYTAKSLYGDKYNAHFDAFMDRNHEAITQAMKKKKGFHQWLPLVRAHSFERDGSWEGLASKRLRNKSEEDMPADCSMNAWEQRWNSSRESWHSFLEGRDLPRAEWTQVLTLDPHWVKLRSPAPTWIRPGSYYDACLLMAMKALQRLQMANYAEIQKIFIARLGWQLGLIQGTGRNDNFEMSGTLWALSCIEDSLDSETLPNCLASATLRTEWRKRLEAGMSHRRLVMLIEKRSDLDSEKFSLFQRYLTEWLEVSPVMWQKYDEEILFYKEIVNQQGRVKAAVQLMQQKNPQLHWDY